MKKRCVVVTVIITALNVVSAVLIDNKMLMAFVCLLVTGTGVALLYYWLLEPVLEMKNKLRKMSEENQRIENLRKEFVANVTHELKTPLTSISGFVETLQDGAAEDPEIRSKFIDIIAIESSRLKRLIEDLLVLSEIENKKEAAPEKIDVKRSITDTVEIIRPIAESRRVNVIMQIEEPLYIKGSGDRFRQMMVNLIENAIKYSNEGGRVWVKGRKESGRIVISVKDEGIGIAEENRDRLFERFYRVDKSRSRKVGGTGLGLSIVKHIAALFGADLKVESEIGKGSEFCVIF